MELLKVGSLGKAYKTCPTFREQERGVYTKLCEHHNRSQWLASKRSNA